MVCVFFLFGFGWFEQTGYGCKEERESEEPQPLFSLLSVWSPLRESGGINAKFPQGSTTLFCLHTGASIGVQCSKLEPFLFLLQPIYPKVLLYCLIFLLFCSPLLLFSTSCWGLVFFFFFGIWGLDFFIC